MKEAVFNRHYAATLETSPLFNVQILHKLIKIMQTTLFHKQVFDSPSSGFYRTKQSTKCILRWALTFERKSKIISDSAFLRITKKKNKYKLASMHLP